MGCTFDPGATIIVLYLPDDAMFHGQDHEPIWSMEVRFKAVWKLGDPQELTYGNDHEPERAASRNCHQWKRLEQILLKKIVLS